MFCCGIANHEQGVDYVDEQKPFVFEIVIDRRRDKRLGLDLDLVSERKILPVRSIISKQLVEDWNVMHVEEPNMRVRPGDRIVSVHGMGGRADDMMKALRDCSKASTTIRLVRWPNDAHDVEDQDVLDAGETHRCHREKAAQAGFNFMVAGLAIASGSMMSFGGSPRSNAIKGSMEEQRVYDLASYEKGSAESARKALLIDESRRELPAPWLAIWSKSQQKYYYFNPTTQESEWRKPLPNPDNEGEEESNGSIVGSWMYPDGAYTISKHGNELRYSEDAHGIHGIVHEQDGWLVVDLRLVRGQGEEGVLDQAESIGRLRFLAMGQAVISNFQRAGSQVWEEDVVASKAMRMERPEGPSSLVGTWSYHNGTYSVSRKEDRLLYEESCYGIYGWLEEVEEGWMFAELRALGHHPGEPAETVGFIRLKRHGPHIVSNYKGPDDVDWEHESFATKEVGSVEGEWVYPGGAYTITNKQGFLLYEEALVGIYGVLQQEASGWLEADLLTAAQDGGGRNEEHDEKKVGKIRLQRRSNTLVSNFRANEVAPWERDIVATRVDRR